MNLILNCEIAMIPPSVNHYWLASGKNRFISAKGKAFQQVVQLMLGNQKPSEARLRIEVELCFATRARRDIDNCLKALLDSLTKSGLCYDDEQFDEIFVKRGNVVKGGLTIVRVYELA